jgi:hypothetical protein
MLIGILLSVPGTAPAVEKGDPEAFVSDEGLNEELNRIGAMKPSEAPF